MKNRPEYLAVKTAFTGTITAAAVLPDAQIKTWAGVHMTKNFIGNLRIALAKELQEDADATLAAAVLAVVKKTHDKATIDCDRVGADALRLTVHLAGAVEVGEIEK